MQSETPSTTEVCALNSADGSSCNCGCPPSHRRASKLAYSALALMLAAVFLAVGYLVWTTVH